MSRYAVEEGWKAPPQLVEDYTKSPWGHVLDRNIGEVVMGFNNVGRLWLDKKNDIDKNAEFAKWLGNQSFNIMGIAECGIN